MKKLSKEQFQNAKNFLMGHSRPLEKALFSFHFEGGEKEAVISALSEFQNDDGGLGNALEPDLRMPKSSALATSVGLRTLIEIGASSGELIVDRSINYLMETLDRENNRWVIAPEGREDFPHAPWWGGNVLESFRGCHANPTAELVGQLLHYSEKVDEDLLGELVNSCVEYLLKTHESGSDFEMHDLMCYQKLVHARGLDSDLKERMTPILIEYTDKIVEKKRENWSGYGARPLWLCEDLDSVVYSSIESEVQENLDFEIEDQNDDGSWAPFWSWGNSFPEIWPDAKREWSGHLTLNNLLRMRRFGRLD